MAAGPALGGPDEPEDEVAAPPPHRGLFRRLGTEERRRVIAEPGASWREWFYRSFLKWYGLLGLLIVDSMLVGYWLEVPSLLGLLLTLVPALYLEFLLYQYLWHEPHLDALRPSRSTRAPTGARRSWVHPFAFGRWSVTGQNVRAGIARSPSGAAEPDPHEFI